MSKFLSGRQSNLKLGVAGYTESKTVLETTGKVGIGTTDAQQHSLFVVGSTNITGDTSVGGDLSVAGTSSLTGDTTVGSAITMYASSGIVSATAFYGDGSNLENTGATLSAAAGTQRLVVTSLTSGTMVDAATDSDLTYNATTDTLNVENIDVDGHTELDQLRVTGVSTFAGNVDISSNGNLTVAGNLIVQGTETRLNTTALEVEDINIGIASATPKLSNASLDGAGITIYGSAGDKTLTWSNANSRMEFNTDVNVANLELDDNQKAKFGTGDDLQIYHDGNHSRIVDSGTGNLVIQSNRVDIQDAAGAENIAIFQSDGSVDLFHNNVKKFETTDGGIDITGHTETDTLRVSGVSTFQGNVHLDDNTKIMLGASNDLQILHLPGTGNSIQGTQPLFLSSTSEIHLREYGGAEVFGKFIRNGAVELYYDNSLKFETIGYGVTIYNDLTVGTGVTIYGNAGIVSATSFFGDGSNLTNTGATLSATSGVERLVTTQLTSGTMVDAATDADLTFDAGTNTLNTQNIKISGGISTNGSSYGQDGQLLRSTGTGWEWRTVPGIFSVNNILNGFNVLEEGSQVGTAGSIHTLDFRGINVFASGDPQPNGIATITFSPTPTFTGVNLTGVSTITGTITAGSSEGVVGQYLRHVGTGVTWASFPQLRVTQTNTANAGQTTFNFSYNVDFLDVFVNGVKLTSSEYSANNGSQIVLNTPAFAGEIVEFHSYNVASTYGAGSGGGASNLTGLSDVNFPIALADDQLLQFNSSTNVWENVAVTSLPYATEAFVGLATAGLASEAFVGLSTAGLASEAFVGLATAGLASEAFVGLATAGLASEAFVGLATAGLLTEHQSLIGKANVTISDAPPGIGTAHGDLWWESDTAKGHIYYNDGSSAQWVEFNPSSGGGGGGGGGSYGNSDVDSHLNVSGASSGQILSWNGSDYAWVADQTGGGSGITTANINADTLNVSGITTLKDLKFDAAGAGIEFTPSSQSGSASYMEFWVGNNSGTHYATIDASGGAFQLFNTSHPTGTLDFRAKEDFSFQVNGYYSILNQSNGGVKLFHPGSQGNILSHKLETLGIGVTVVGTTFSNQLSVSGVATATSFVKSGGTSSQYLMADGSVSVGAGSTNLVTTWTLGANGSSDYTFTGPGVAAGAQDPTIYLVRGQTYKFENRSGGHPFRIQYEFQNTGGTAYNDGIVNNAANHNTDLYWEVRNDAPDLLHYQCTAHQNMSGRIVILGDVVSSGSWTASAGTAQTIDTITGVANNAIKTAEYTIHIENGSNMQAQKVLVMQDGTTAFSQEYAIMHKSGLLVSMSATISGGNLLLQATPETGVTGTTTYKVTRQTMR